MLSDNPASAHNAGQAQVVIEEFMAGEEASFIVVADGRHALALATSQDHKRIGDGDTGPNTGGMGAYSPAPVVTPAVHARVMREVIQPTIAGMAADGHPFSGFLYAGLMIDGEGKARVVEFNARLGDPEAQVLLMRLKSDLFELLMAATDAQGQRRARHRTAMGPPQRARRRHGLCRLPGEPAQGRCDHGPSGGHGRHACLPCRHQRAAPTARSSPAAAACSPSPRSATRCASAQQRAYAALAPIRFDGMQFRRDIGHRALKAR